MARKKAHTPEEIVAKLRQTEVLVVQGKSVAEAVRVIGVTERNYPPPFSTGSRCDGLEEGAEDAGARREAGGVDHGAYVRLALGSPHCAIAVRHLALDHGGAEVALAGVVRRLDLARPVHEGQELVARSSQFCLQRPRQLAPARGC